MLSMTPILLAMIMLAQPECRVDDWTTKMLAQDIRDVEKMYVLPDGLLGAVVLAESGGKNFIVHIKGGCDAGVAQVHIHGCKRSAVKKLIGTRANLIAAGEILARSRKVCTEDHKRFGCKRSIWARYNAGSCRWWPRVNRIWRSMKDTAVRLEPYSHF